MKHYVLKMYPNARIMWDDRRMVFELQERRVDGHLVRWRTVRTMTWEAARVSHRYLVERVSRPTERRLSRRQ